MVVVGGGMVVVQVEVVLGADQLNLLHWTRPLLHIHLRHRSHYRRHCLASQFLEFLENSLFDEKVRQSSKEPAVNDSLSCAI